MRESKKLLPKPCPVPSCIGGVLWDDDGPIGRCPVCEGDGVVSLGAWLKYTFGEAKRGAGDGNT